VSFSVLLLSKNELTQRALCEENDCFGFKDVLLSHASAEAQGNVVRAICLSKVNPHF
jgi:hypothetical protein